MTTPKQVKRIGRKLGLSDLASIIDSGNAPRIFTLASGKKVSFERKIIANGDIKSSTFVDPLVNGRDQATITRESVEDIIRTITLQQFFPAIGRLRDNQIEIMDGSRRRAACLFSGASLEVLVTHEEIDLVDARRLAADIQTAKEHNLRELGLRFALMYENGMSKSDIAKSEGISNAKVTRAFQAASVPVDIINLFPVVSELTLPDYKLLLKVTDDAMAEGVEISDVVQRVLERINAEGNDVAAETSDEVKGEILAHFRKIKRQLKDPSLNSHLQTEKLATFEDRNAYARRKTNSLKRTVKYEFCRLPKATADALDAAIKEILNQND